MEFVAPEAKIWIGNNIASLDDRSCPELDVRYNGHLKSRRFMARLKPSIVLLAKRKMEALRMAAFSLANIPTPATLFSLMEFVAPEAKIWIGNNIASLDDRSCPELDVRYNGHLKSRRFMARLKPSIVLLAKRKMEALRMAAFSLANIPTPATLFLLAKASVQQSRNVILPSLEHTTSTSSPSSLFKTSRT